MEILADITRACLLTAHLLASGLAATGPLLCVVFRLIPGVRRESDAQLRSLAIWSFVALVAGLLIGLASGAMLWLAADASYRQAVLRFPAHAYSMLALEWLFTAVLYAVFIASWRKLSGRPWLWLHALIGLAAATNLLYHFPTMMILIGRLAMEPTFALDAEITRPVFRQLIVEPNLLAKTAHFWSLSLLVAGLAAVGVAGRADEQRATSRMATAGNLFALLGLALLVVSGMVTLFQLDAGPQRTLLGGNLLATTLFAAAITAALAIGYTLLTMILDRPSRELIRRAAVLLVLATLSMVVAGQQTVPPLP